MKFDRFLYLEDIDLSNAIQQYGDGTHIVFIFETFIIFNVVNTHFYCCFQKEEYDIELTKEFVLSFVENMNKLIGRSITFGITQMNPIVSNRDIQSLISINRIDTKEYNQNASFDILNTNLEILQDVTATRNGIYHIVWDKQLLLSLNNEKSARKLFESLKCSVLKMLQHSINILKSES